MKEFTLLSHDKKKRSKYQIIKICRLFISNKFSILLKSKPALFILIGQNKKIVSALII